jgi:hypothetical protein
LQQELRRPVARQQLADSRPALRLRFAPKQERVNQAVMEYWSLEIERR